MSQSEAGLRDLKWKCYATKILSLASFPAPQACPAASSAA
jgi:hypothetical protein